MAFEDMDSTLNVQQYIQQLVAKDHSDVDAILTPPTDLVGFFQLFYCSTFQDEGVWKYEHLRQFCLQLNALTFELQSECVAETCVQMTATEQWIFLCAAHKNPKEVIY